MTELLIVFGFVTLLMFIIFGFVVFIKFIEYKGKVKAVEDKLDKSERVQFQEEMTSLKHRVMVLEKIVTDKGYQLDEEIAKLKSIK